MVLKKLHPEPFFLNMESWFSRGEGFVLEPTDQSFSAKRRIAQSEVHYLYRNHLNDERKKSNWNHEDFLSTFSVEDQKHKVSSPEHQVIYWSESSSDGEEDVKIKTEAKIDDRRDSPHQDSCQIKRRIHHRRKMPSERKKNLGDISLSRKVFLTETLRHKQGDCSREAEFPTKQPLELRLSKSYHTLPETRPLSVDKKKGNDSGSEGKSTLSENERIHKTLTQTEGSPGIRNLNQWTLSSFDFPSSAYSISTKGERIKTDKGKQQNFFPDETLSPGGSTESMPPDIEDCVSSCSDVGSVDDLGFDDIDDDDDDDDKGAMEHKETGRHVKKDKRSATSFECHEQRSKEMDATKPSILQVTNIEGAKCDIMGQGALELSDPESQNISNESPLSQESQPNISGLSSSESSKSSQKIGASHWASVFQHQVSPPHEDQTMPVNEDSGKKRKYVSDSKSLAGQLARLVSREKSAIRFWNHSLTAGSLEDKTKKYLKVKINSISRQFSFSVCECDIIKGQPASSFTVCKVLVSRNSAVKIGLNTGMTLQIFPPWQQLDDGKTVTLLCTNYMQAVMDRNHSALGSPTHPSPSSSQSLIPQASLSKGMPALISSRGLRKGSTERHLHFQWSCPCSNDDRYVNISSCPASKPEFNLLNHVPQSLLVSPQIIMLHSITSSARSLNSSGCHQNTLLESIEKAHQNGNCLPPFVSVLLRVFRLKNDENNVSLVLLIEDASGTLAIVSYCEEQWDVAVESSIFASLMKKEGRQCLCGGLQVHQRVSKEKDPSLFSIISQCWLQRKPMVASQDSSDQDYPNWQLKVPSFCYVLQPSSNVLPIMDSRDEHEQPVKFDLTPLEQMAQTDSRRFSSMVVVLSFEVMFESNKSCRIVAFDPHPSSEFSSSYRLNISEDCKNIFWSQTQAWTSLCLLKDVVVKNGMLCFDKYSSLIAQSFWETLGIKEKLDRDTVQSACSCHLQLPALTSTVNPGDIVSLSGLISSVDEESSYSWQACNKCGCEIALSSKHTRTFCASCHQPVEETVVKIKLTVMLDVEQISKDIAVKISLNATTIQFVLPDEVDEEGYDVEHVMGKTVKAAACIVQTRTPRQICLEQLDLTSDF